MAFEHETSDFVTGDMSVTRYSRNCFEFSFVVVESVAFVLLLLEAVSLLAGLD